jgi:hypothetical protein
MVKCQSSEVPVVGESQAEPGAYEVSGSERVLTYRPREVTLDDGTLIAHESQGGTLSSVWATDLGDRYVEVAYLGDGPVGGELVLVVPDQDVVVIGDLYATDPAAATIGWAEAVDLTLGLTTVTTTILSSSGPVARDDLEAFHQRLLGVLYA